MTSGIWPGDVFVEEGGFKKPLTGLLRDMRLLEHEEEQTERGLKGALQNVTPASVQVLTAGATSLSKVSATGTGLAGLLGVGSLKAWTDSLPAGSPTVSVLVVASGLVMAATVIAVAFIVRSDLEARAAASSARYRARAETAAALLNSFAQCRPEAAAYVAWPHGCKTAVPITAFKWHQGRIVPVTADGTEVDPADIEQLLPSQ